MADKICFSFWDSKSKIRRDLHVICAAVPKIGEEVYFDGIYIVKSVEHSMNYHHMDDGFHLETTVFLEM